MGEECGVPPDVLAVVPSEWCSWRDGACCEHPNAHVPRASWVHPGALLCVGACEVGGAVRRLTPVRDGAVTSQRDHSDGSSTEIDAVEQGETKSGSPSLVCIELGASQGSKGRRLG